MIKVIAFDLVGVLVFEKDIELSATEDKLERLFGPNISDSDYIIKGRELVSNDSILIRTTEEIINKLYEVKDKDIFNKIKEQYPDKKIIIATNHVSFVRNFIGESFDVKNLDDLIISAEIHKIKPNRDFYEHILNKYNLKPEELLFIDDNNNNCMGASNLGIKTIHVTKDMDLIKEIFDTIK